MVYLCEMDDSNGFISVESAVNKGRELTNQYQSADPFPHVVLEDFLPTKLLETCVTEFPTQTELANELIDIKQEKLKYNYNPDVLTAGVRGLFYAFNSRPFVRVIENITGIKGLIPDPFFLGGGFHEIRQGGHLAIHADFNHHKPMDLERRVNVLIYLNKDWQDGYGGQLELWDNEMTRPIHSIVPIFNRCVIFNTTSNSNHGNPSPINHPNNVSRRSIALYYYTATWSEAKRSHTTQFQVRPKSDDRIDWTAKVREGALELLPPILTRKLGSLRRSVKK